MEDTHRHLMQQRPSTALNSPHRQETVKTAATGLQIASRQITSVLPAEFTSASANAFATITQTCEHALFIHAVISLPPCSMRARDLLKLARASIGSLPPTKG